MEPAVVIGWILAGVAAFSGVAFLTKMALRKPKRRTAEDMMEPKRIRRWWDCPACMERAIEIVEDGKIIKAHECGEATMTDMSERVTGTSGNVLQDGLTRATWVAAVQAVVAFSVVRWAWLTTEELAILTIPITFMAVAAWGVFDALRPTK